MPLQIKLGDENTLKVLKALFSDSIEVSYKKMEKKTGLRKSKIRNRIKYLMKTGILKTFEPELSSIKTDFKIRVYSFLRLRKDTEVYKKLEKSAVKDPHFLAFGELFGERNLNTYALQTYRDYHEWQKHVNERYWEGIPGFRKTVKDRMFFVIPTDAFEKYVRTSEAINNVIQGKEEGPDRKLYSEDTKKVIAGLFGDSYEISYKKVHRSTGLSKSVIYKRLNFLRDEGIFEGIVPRLDPIKCGFKFRPYAFFDINKENKRGYKKLLKRIIDDPFVSSWGPLVGEQNLNAYKVDIQPSVEEWMAHVNEYYYDQIPELYRMVRKRLFFVLPIESCKKFISSSRAIMEVMTSEAGI